MYPHPHPAMDCPCWQRASSEASSSSSSSSGPSSPVAYRQSFLSNAIRAFPESEPLDYCKPTLSVDTKTPKQERLRVLMHHSLWKRDADAAVCDSFHCSTSFSFRERKHVSPLQRLAECVLTLPSPLSTAANVATSFAKPVPPRPSPSSTPPT